MTATDGMEIDFGTSDMPSINGADKNGISEFDHESSNQPGIDHDGTDKSPETKEALSKVESEEELIARFKTTELEGYWMPVRRDAKDFTAWTSLLDYVEKENKLENIRQAFDAFLHRYPYCYGYWKKYADAEKRHQQVETCLQVYERGVQGIPLSIDLWLSYIDAVMDFHRETEDYISRMRNLYNRAINSAGMDFRSDKLWENFIQWELSTHSRVSLRLVTALYDRLIYTPTQMYYQNWENFKRHFDDNPIEDILSPEEFNALKIETLTEMDLPEDCELTENEFARIKDKARTLREQIYHRTYEEITKRWHFEDKIRRPYFHVKPLETSQIVNWNEYLDFEERELESLPPDSDENLRLHQRARVLFLYERCLVACALYEEIWLRYARYNENILQEVETSRDVWRRACTIHLPHKLGLRWMWACFEERHYVPTESEISNSWNTRPSWLILEETMREEDGWYPSHKHNVLFHMRRIDMMRRLGASNNEISTSYDESIAYFGQKQNNSAVNIMTARYARFMQYILLDHARAKDILLQAIDKDQRNERLYSQLLDLVFHNDCTDEINFCEVIDMALERSLLSLNSKLQFAKRRLQYLEEYGNNVTSIRGAQEDFERLLKAYNHTREEAGLMGEHIGGPPAKQPLFESANALGDGYSGHSVAQSHQGPQQFGAPSLLGPGTIPAETPAASMGWDQYAAYYAAYANSTYTASTSVSAVQPHVYSN